MFRRNENDLSEIEKCDAEIRHLFSSERSKFCNYATGASADLISYQKDLNKRRLRPTLSFEKMWKVSILIRILFIKKKSNEIDNI